jgi:RNA polymerase sigma factor (sigma-70 family)
MDPTLTDAPLRRAELEGLFVSSLPDIERVSRSIARRNRLGPAEADDFCSEVNLKIIENNYAVFASFQGRSSLRTYLTTVIQRLFLDYRRRAWGKWRPSAEAHRRGPLAIRLEALLYRDGLSLEEALETMRTNLACEESREALTALAHNLPQRTSRRAISDGGADLESVSAPEFASPEVQLEGATTSARTQALIDASMLLLSAQDRIVLRLRFEDDISVADIARTLHLDQKRLYRRIEDLLQGFRKTLEGQGLGWPEVTRMIERGQCHLRLPMEPGEMTAARPSHAEAQA